MVRGFNYLNTLDMLYINDEKIDLQGILAYRGNDPLMNVLKAKVIEIKEYPRDIRFKYRPGVIRLNKKENLPEGKKTIISWDELVPTDRGTERWTVATGRVKLPNGTYRYQNKSTLFLRDLRLDRERDLDKILFLLIASNRIRSGLIILENKEKEAMTRLSGSIDKDELKLIILKMPLAKLRHLASALQVDKASTKTEFVLREETLSAADNFAKKGKKSYSEIIRMIRSEAKTSVLANIQLAQEMGILGFQNNVFGFLNEEGRVTEDIVHVPVIRESEKVEILVAAFDETPSVYEKLVKEITAVKGLIKDPVDTPSTPDAGEIAVSPGNPVDPAPAAMADGVADEILQGIRQYAIEHVALPFTDSDKDKIKEIAAIAGIDGARGGRPYTTVYEDLKKFFGLE